MKSTETELLTSCLHFAQRITNVPRSGIREIIGAMNGRSLISFGGGVPHDSCIPLCTINQALENVLVKYGKEAFAYGSTEGEVDLRAFIAEQWLKRVGIKADPAEIIIVNGSQQALDLLGKLFIDPASPLLMERPSYVAALQAFSVYEPLLYEVELDGEGPCIDVLKKQLLNRNHRFFYSCPTFQNPTGECYSYQRRHEIISLLNKTGTLLIEDDPYGQLFYEESPPMPMCSLGIEHGIYLGTFSKIIAPGMRLGWIWADKKIMRHLVTVKQAADLCTGRFQQNLLYETLMLLNLDEHLSKNRKFYKNQRELFQLYMKRYLDGFAQWKKPSGGMFFWADTGTVSSSILLKKCLERGVAFADGSGFFASNYKGTSLRLNFTQVSEPQMDQGIKIIGEQIALMH